MRNLFRRCQPSHREPTLAEKAAEWLRQLSPLPRPITGRGFIRHVAQIRRYQIEVMSTSAANIAAVLDPGAHGFFLKLAPDRYIVVVNEETPPPTQERTLVHEGSHIFCGHTPILRASTALRLIFPDFPPELLRTLFYHPRDGGEGPEEDEAEYLMTAVYAEAGEVPALTGAVGTQTVEIYAHTVAFLDGWRGR